MTVVIACDKFKGSLSAAEVCESLRVGLLQARPALAVVSVPMSDGGEGTVDAAVAAGFEEIRCEVSGPLGHPVDAEFAWDVATRTALVEMAQASGLQRLPGGVLSPLEASSFGTGELVRAALDAGAMIIILAVGGSACTDGGAGFLQALGASLRSVDGRELRHGGGALSEISTIDLTAIDSRLAGCHVILASDVDNVLTGPHGAAAVYGPQKGATEADVEHLDRALGRFADILGHTPGATAQLENRPGAGAAGGLGFAAMAVLDARQRPGVQLMMELVGLDDTIRHLTPQDLVITGEGSLDGQTLSGKAVAGVALAARSAGVPVVAVCGQLHLDAEQLQSNGISRAYALTDIEGDIRRCIDDAAELLKATGMTIAQEWT